MASAGKNGVALNLHSGEIVQIRSKEEILATLDDKGRLNGLPFMPEMLKHCGKQVRVYKSAHKTCDTVDLEGLRCGGEAHGACQAGCMLFWNEAWLRRVPVKSESVSPANGVNGKHGKCSEETLWSNTTRATNSNDQVSQDFLAETYVCQTTEIPKFSKPLRWWDIRQYVKDVTSGNVTVRQVIEAIAFRLFQLVLRVGGYRALTSAYDWFQRTRGGTPYPFREGKVASKTPLETLNLQPGEMVQVKSYEEILETVNKVGKNRGMRFDAELVKYCGKPFKVLGRVERIIDEKTGTMRRLQNDCIVLENVICAGQLTALRTFCPTATQAYWREIWLRRISDVPQVSAQHCLTAVPNGQ